MAYKSYDELWRSDFYKHVSTQDRLQYTNPNPLNVKVSEIYKKFIRKMRNSPHNFNLVRMKMF